MTEDEFWTLIEDGRSAGAREQMAWIREKLVASEVRDVVAFYDHVDRCMDALYTHELWAVTYIIRHGCSDDSFSDFRACVIANGRSLFTLAFTNPAEFGLQYDPGACALDCDAMQYVAGVVHDELTGAGWPPRSTLAPRVPAGEDWEDDDLPERFPLVWEKWA